MMFCTYTSFIHEYSNEFILNRIYFTKYLILPTITNKLIRKKLHPNNSILISLVSTKEID